MTDQVKSYAADIVQFLRFGTFEPVSYQQKPYKSREVEARFASFSFSPEPFFNFLTQEDLNNEQAGILFPDVMQCVRQMLLIEE